MQSEQLMYPESVQEACAFLRKRIRELRANRQDVSYITQGLDDLRNRKDPRRIIAALSREYYETKVSEADYDSMYDSILRLEQAIFTYVGASTMTLNPAYVKSYLKRILYNKKSQGSV